MYDLVLCVFDFMLDRVYVNCWVLGYVDRFMYGGVYVELWRLP